MVEATENIPEISDLEGYRSDFHNLFGLAWCRLQSRSK
jgi:trans-2-enoyl-CoA reductase